MKLSIMLELFGKMHENGIERSSTGGVIEIISTSNETMHPIRAGIFPKTLSSSLPSELIDSRADEGLKALIGAWTMAIAREQRNKRTEIFTKITKTHELKWKTEKEPLLT